MSKETIRLPPVRAEVEGESVSAELKALLWAVYGEIARRPTDLRSLKGSMTELLRFLASPEGRTDANCRAADSFFGLERDWETSTEHLPEGYREVLFDMGGALHDTVSAPEIAENFHSTPEQLLARLTKLL